MKITFGPKLFKNKTVLEGPSGHDDGVDNCIYSHGYLSEYDGSPKRWGEKSRWCRPSCIPISLICLLIFLVVLLPLLDHATEKALYDLNTIPSDKCDTGCQFSLVETIPEGLNYTDPIENPSTYDVWLDLLDNAQKSIEIASFYWTLRKSEIYPDPSSIKGEAIFQTLLKAGISKGVTVKIAQNAPSHNFPNTDTEYLVRRGAAEVRSLNFAKLLGGGVLHTKFLLIDRKHIYLGSANMDWRALTQVKEMGILIHNCTCLANDLGKIFDVYWKLGANDSKIPDHWPANLSTNINLNMPANLTINGSAFQGFISSSPAPFNPTGRTNDIDALLHIIKTAEKFIYFAVMDYFPLTIYTPKKKYWPLIDDALKEAAIERKVKIRFLISWWNHSAIAEDYFLRSLLSLDQSYPGVHLLGRRFIVPANDEQKKIPFARVNHNKYMVTDNAAFIGTSNWSGDYFIDTAGVSFVIQNPHHPHSDFSHHESPDSPIRRDLELVFLRDWQSDYVTPIPKE